VSGQGAGRPLTPRRETSPGISRHCATMHPRSRTGASCADSTGQGERFGSSERLRSSLLARCAARSGTARRKTRSPWCSSRLSAAHFPPRLHHRRPLRAGRPYRRLLGGLGRQPSEIFTTRLDSPESSLLGISHRRAFWPFRPTGEMAISLGCENLWIPCLRDSRDGSPRRRRSARGAGDVGSADWSPDGKRARRHPRRG
jgi:hypothetical protein